MGQDHSHRFRNRILFYTLMLLCGLLLGYGIGFMRGWWSARQLKPSERENPEHKITEDDKAIQRIVSGQHEEIEAAIESGAAQISVEVRDVSDFTPEEIAANEGLRNLLEDTADNRRTLRVSSLYGQVYTLTVNLDANHQLQCFSRPCVELGVYEFGSDGSSFSYTTFRVMEHTTLNGKEDNSWRNYITYSNLEMWWGGGTNTCFTATPKVGSNDMLNNFYDRPEAFTEMVFLRDQPRFTEVCWNSLSLNEDGAYTHVSAPLHSIRSSKTLSQANFEVHWTFDVFTSASKLSTLARHVSMDVGTEYLEVTAPVS